MGAAGTPQRQPIAQAAAGAPNGAPLHDERHRPGQTTLYRLGLDGICRCDADGVASDVEAFAPTDDELHALLQIGVRQAQGPFRALVSGLALHAAVRVDAHHRKRLEPLCRGRGRSAFGCKAFWLPVQVRQPQQPGAGGMSAPTAGEATSGGASDQVTVAAIG